MLEKYLKYIFKQVFPPQIPWLLLFIYKINNMLNFNENGGNLLL